MSKVALITGASAGMGYEAAKLFAREGWTVYAAARRLERMEDLKPHGVRPVAMDITRPEDTARVVEQILAEEGRIDVLINNAGFGLYGPVEEVPIDEARYQFEVNLFGLAELTQRVLPHMRAQGSGRIINVSSMGGKVFMPMGAWYHATKHALEALSDSLRLELAPFGIHVSIIEPGGIRTAWGNIVADRLKKLYPTSAYKAQIDPILKAMDGYDRNPRGTAPEVLAAVFLKAATDPRPKRRYVKGFGAKPAIFIRKWLGDGAWEWVIRRAIG
ncbi:MAG: SDR family NAD(P)-dependent oxidoreductase [Alphaproteobacteria bacterium]|nr:MAG: SDR family NAD(P)-dependent oxidoreductase [Alphaproteobacteria bacterium]